MKNNKNQKVTNFLYHLGKGLWKSVPVLGPIVEEIIYEQFESEFKSALNSEVKKLDNNKLEEILTKIKYINVKSIDKKLDSLSDEMKWNNVKFFTDIVEVKIKYIEKKVEPIPDILEIVNKIRENLHDKKGIEIALNNLIQRREEWIQRISKNQKKLLDNIPSEYTPINKIWILAKKIIPECSYKEFRFRLHELEWISLTHRYWDNEKTEWFYKRI